MPTETPFEVTSASVEDLVARASETPVLDASQQARLAARLKGGQQDALSELIEAHLRVAVDEAIRNRGLGLPQDVLVREAARALVACAPVYDPDRHGSFARYARRKIRAAIQGALGF